MTADTLQPPSRPLRNMLSRLRLKCKYEENGCTEIVELDRIESVCRSF